MLLLRALVLAVVLLVDGAEPQAIPASDGSTPEWAPKVFSTANVLSLTSENFTDTRQAHIEHGLLVAFNAPWCAFCKHVAPEYAQAADDLAARGVMARLATVDAIAESSLAEQHGIDTFPTFLWFSPSSREAAPVEYRGVKRKGDFVKWVVRRATPEAAQEFSLALGAIEWIRARTGAHQGADGSVGVFALLPEGDQTLQDAFEVAAKRHEAVSFASTTMIDVFRTALHEACAISGAQLPEEGGDSAHSVRAFLVKTSPGGDPADAVELIPRTAANLAKPNLLVEALEDLIATHSLPLVVPFTEAYEEEIFASLTTRRQLIAIGSARAREANEAMLRAIAKTFRGDLIVVFADTASDDSHGLVDFFRMERGEAGLHYFGFNADGEKRYAPSQDLAQLSGNALHAALEDFARGVLDGTALPLVVSEAVPERNDEPVKIVVAKTFDDIVMRPGYDVLLEVHAPWCGHCKALEPFYRELALRFGRTSKPITIAKLDGTLNEVPGLEYDGYPTLYLYTASNQRVEVGDEVERTVEGLEAFVRDHAEAFNGRTSEEQKKSKEEL